jgi:hypothetical protein
MSEMKTDTEKIRAMVYVTLTVLQTELLRTFSCHTAVVDSAPHRTQGPPHFLSMESSRKSSHHCTEHERCPVHGGEGWHRGVWVG